MLESPIKRKHFAYPKDFTQTVSKSQTETKKYTFNQQNQIEANQITRYDQIADSIKSIIPTKEVTIQQKPNPEISFNSLKENQEDQPLNPHSLAIRPKIDNEILKKPRFSMIQNEEIPQNVDLMMQDSTSPGCIKKQMEKRQGPLPLENPCNIELLKMKKNKAIDLNIEPYQKPNKNIIKFSSHGDLSAKRWQSSQKQLIQSFNESNIKNGNQQLPLLGKSNQSQAHQLYQNAKTRRKSYLEGFGKVNTSLYSMKKEELKHIDLPKFEPKMIKKLQKQINQLAKINKKGHSQSSSDSSRQNNEDYSEPQRQQNRKRKSDYFPSSHQRIDIVVSYRSSLSYLKDLYTKFESKDSYRLLIKIPKIFTDKLIYKNQEKSQLYQTAKQIFNDLKLANDNLIVKRYSNCTAIISRNICLIWHFNGKRYLGGWQTEYLDEGFKHGLGLEWEPKHYVYYGEFIKNKKEGLGVYKDKNEVVYVGYWKNGKRKNPQMSRSKLTSDEFSQLGQSRSSRGIIESRLQNDEELSVDLEEGQYQ